jgi:hypothetical protein
MALETIFFFTQAFNFHDIEEERETKVVIESGGWLLKQDHEFKRNGR